MRECLNCQKDISDKHYNAKFCCIECRKIYNHNKKYDNISDIPVCIICGLKGKSLTSHINDVHNMKVEEYLREYKLETKDVFHSSYLKKLSEKNKGEKNPAYKHDGKYSPFSKNFVKYKNLTDEEKEKKINKLMIKKGISAKKNQNIPNQIGYWMKRGYTKDQSRIKVSERQSTFSKKKCIETYGEEKGLRIWKERQKKWQDTLKSKPKEEIEKIRKSMIKNSFSNGFSKISQKLFWSLYEKIKNDFENIYFAELGKRENNEYMILFEDKTIAFPDFLVEDTNKVIEFDGDYWHGKKRGNQERDKKRDEKIKNAGYDILHIRERDYKNNSDDVIKNCLEFIYG